MAITTSSLNYINVAGTVVFFILSCITLFIKKDGEGKKKFTIIGVILLIAALLFGSNGVLTIVVDKKEKKAAIDKADSIRIADKDQILDSIKKSKSTTTFITKKEEPDPVMDCFLVDNNPNPMLYKTSKADSLGFRIAFGVINNSVASNFRDRNVVFYIKQGKLIEITKHLAPLFHRSINSYPVKKITLNGFIKVNNDFIGRDTLYFYFRLLYDNKSGVTQSPLRKLYSWSASIKETKDINSLTEIVGNTEYLKIQKLLEKKHYW